MFEKADFTPQICFNLNKKAFLVPYYKYGNLCCTYLFKGVFPSNKFCLSSDHLRYQGSKTHLFDKTGGGTRFANTCLVPWACKQGIKSKEGPKSAAKNKNFFPV